MVFVGSKNIKAPGPGVASYSVAKAGLQQLARVATMELAPSGIRVNTVHPDAVFDTGVWTDDILTARAAKYNMSVDAYKKRNLLKASITAKDVAKTIFSLSVKICKPQLVATCRLMEGMSALSKGLKVDLRFKVTRLSLFIKVRVQKYTLL